MDPALRELAERGDRDEQIEALIRLAPESEGRLPAQVREVSRFADICTVRLRRGDIAEVWSHPYTASFKAPRMLEVDAPLGPEFSAVDAGGEGFGQLFDPPTREVPRQPPPGSRGGAGTIVAIIDWGFDVLHPRAFLDPHSGQSRVRALWDQRGGELPDSPRWGYGRVIRKAEIDAALRHPEPYRKLGYHPGDADSGFGAHGTHVADVAAGTPGGGLGGMAPKAELLLVHLASEALSGLATLGDSVRLCEALDWIAEEAGDTPFVVNLSAGRHGGPHTGLTLVEQVFDRFLEAQDNRMIVQSGGNYHRAAAHASGILLPGHRAQLDWEIPARDLTPNELEIWYADRDRFVATLFPPGARTGFRVPLGDARGLYGEDGREIGKIYHRAYDSNSPDHHIEVFLDKSAPGGTWRLVLEGELVEDGRYHAWIERDRAGRRGQSRFSENCVDQLTTIGSICNGFLPIVVGAVDDRHDPPRPASFASTGPTRDGRQKPDVVGPGMRIRAARSAPRRSRTPIDRTTIMSGASQASPYVAGLVACLLSDAPHALNVHEIRRRLFAMLRTLPEHHYLDGNRFGAGLVDPARYAAALTERTDHEQHL